MSLNKAFDNCHTGDQLKQRIVREKATYGLHRKVKNEYTEVGTKSVMVTGYRAKVY